MTAFRHWYIACDGYRCDVGTLSDLEPVAFICELASVARTNAQSEGWVRHDGKDLCPACAPSVEESA